MRFMFVQSLSMIGRIQHLCEMPKYGKCYPKQVEILRSKLMEHPSEENKSQLREQLETK